MVANVQILISSYFTMKINFLSSHVLRYFFSSEDILINPTHSRINIFWHKFYEYFAKLKTRVHSDSMATFNSLTRIKAMDMKCVLYTASLALTRSG